jgi:beta-N-acetylhexosaminidase
MGENNVTDPGIRRLALGTVLGVFFGPSLTDEAAKLVADGLAGFTLFAGNIEDTAQVNRLTASIRAIRSEVVLAVDEEGGDVTRLAHSTGSLYPGNAALGVAGNPTVTRSVYQAMGEQLRSVGLNVNLAPTVDVNAAGNDTVIGTRSFGADPALVCVHAGAAVLGLQDVGIAACAKHFPGHGATRDDSHLGLPTVDEPLSVLRARDLPPFAAAVGAGARAIMTAHIRVPELTGADPATFSPEALGLLRDEYGFDGVIVADALEMAGSVQAAGGLEAAAVRALAAGTDLMCFGGEVSTATVAQVVDGIVRAVEDDALTVARLEQAVSRVAALVSWTRTGSVPAPGSPELGYAAARRAILVEGSLDGLAGALVVQLASEVNIAAGRVRWGVVPHLNGNVLEVDHTQESPEGILAHAGTRTIVLVGRQLHRTPDSRAFVEKLAADHPCVVVEMGWPGSWRPSGARGFVTTHGGSHVSGAALVSLLGLRQ